MTRTIVIVRHGNTFAPGDPPRRIGGRTDLPLVASGHAQAAALRLHFAAMDLVFDTVIVGPLLRTRQTASTILASTDTVPIEIAEWLREIDHGPDEGMQEEAVIRRIGRSALDKWDSHAIPPRDWQVDVETLRAHWRDFIVEQTGLPPGRTLVVTSNGIARFVLPSGVPKLRTGAYGCLTLVAGQSPDVIAWNVRPPD